MESQERHDLKENDLQEFLGNLGEFWNRWGNTILIALTIALAIFAGFRFYYMQQREARESAWGALATTASPDAYARVAESHEIPAVKAIAQLRAGDLYLSEARAKTTDENGQSDQTAENQTDQGSETPSQNSQSSDAPDNADQGTSPGQNEPGQLNGNGSASQETDPASSDGQNQGPGSGESREQLLDYAERSYQAVLDLAPATIYQVNARFGLAAVAESRRDLDLARDHYQQVIELAQAEYPNSVVQAENRLDMLPQLKNPVPFGKESQTPPPSAEAPASPSSPSPFANWPWFDD